MRIKHSVNEFFPWMVEWFSRRKLETIVGENMIDWHIFWYDKLENIYEYEAQIIWFGENNRCGYVSINYHSINDKAAINACGPYKSLEELKEAYADTGYQFPIA